MRVALVNYAYDPALGDPDAALERYRTTPGWAEALLASGAEAVVVAWRFACDADRERRGVRYLFRRDAFPPVADARTNPRVLHDGLLAARPDLVHVNGLMFPWQVARLRLELPDACPIVVQDHAGVDPRPLAWWRVRSRWRRRAMHAGLRAADAFLFTSVEQGRAFQDIGVIDPDRPVHAVTESSTTMTRVARDQARQASGLAGSPMVLWVGRLNDNKDPLTVLDGFERALKTIPDARLAMVYTDAPLLDRVHDRLRRASALTDCVRLCGTVPHDSLAPFYSAADLFVLGSHDEGSGYALIESLACGCVPVVTDIPSFRAITAHGSVGALWRPGAAAGCADAIVRMARSDLTARRATVLAHFDRHLSWSAIGRRAVDIYREVGAGRGGGRRGGAG